MTPQASNKIQNIENCIQVTIQGSPLNNYKAKKKKKREREMERKLGTKRVKQPFIQAYLLTKKLFLEGNGETVNMMHVFDIKRLPFRCEMLLSLFSPVRVFFF